MKHQAIHPFTFSMLIWAACIFFSMSCSEPNHNAPTMSASVNPSQLPSLENKKVLLVYGGWDGHQPKVYAEKISGFLKAEGAEVTVSDSTGIYADEAVMSEIDLIVQSITMDKISKEAFDGLQKAVKNGTGFAGSHGGFCDAFRDNTGYQYMTGAQFVAHPGGQIDYTVKITDPSDPITAGIKDFPTKTEQYYLHVDPNIKVLATTTFSGDYDEWINGAVMPVIWKKYFGQGRIFCITLGHDPAEFDQAIPKQLLMNGFRWASGSKYEPKEEWLNPVY